MRASVGKTIARFNAASRNSSSRPASVIERQTNGPSGLGELQDIAAGIFHSAALAWGRTLNYPIEPSRDLLLIYNTNSSDSIAVKNYYLTNRPFVSDALQLGIVGTNVQYFGGMDMDFYASGNDFTNGLLNPLLAWYAANPTKRPGFMVCFLDVPTAMDGNVLFKESLSAGDRIRRAVRYRPPYITYINMGAPPDYGETNRLPDCFAYIDKLARFGSNYSPGKIAISASAGGYGNDYYFLDDKQTFLEPHHYAVALPVYQSLLAQGISSNVLNFFVDTTNTVRYCTNVAGYLSWGSYAWGSFYSAPFVNSVQFGGNSSWYIIETVESNNGRRYSQGQGDYAEWFWHDSFGRTNYEGTPVGMVGHVAEPNTFGVNDGSIYFGLWQKGKYFAIGAWQSQGAPHLLVVGDPFVRR